MIRRLALALAASLLFIAPAAEAAYRVTDSFGRPGRGPGRFGPPRTGFRTFQLGTSPAGIAFAGGTVLVADPLQHRIHRFTKSGRLLGAFGHQGIVPGGAAMLAPQGLVVHRGAVFVAMNGNDRVDVFTRGRWRRMFKVHANVRRTFGFTRGAGPGQLHNPYAIARAPSGFFYVADLTNGRVNRYNAAGYARGQVGSFGTGPGQFLAPFGVAIDAAGSLWVSDRELNRVQKFDAAGRPLLATGETGAGPGDFRSPQGLAVDRSGNVYVADTVNGRIVELASDGRYLGSFGQGVLRQPTYVAVDSDCRVYVSDYRRVVVFAPDAPC
ncbi:MAG: tripartite motif-containing protein 71 [Solirubrobacteraceae bacterium]|jgi:DNA-binding beta-propeller fold protein YncE|nr:tripartite motif-containing protein 71 [Solirubrobacteraceae bacterium]